MNEQTRTIDREGATAVDAEKNTSSYTPTPAHNARRKGLLLLGTAVVLGLAGWGLYGWLTGEHETTDDAYVSGNIVAVNARDAGTVLAVHAESTQSVKAGQVLVDFDPALVNAQIASAEADLAKAVRQVRSGFSRVTTAEAEIAEAEARLAGAKNDLARRDKAVAAGAVSGEEVAHAGDAIRSATAALQLAQSHRVDAESAVGGASVTTNPAVMAAIAAVQRAAIAQDHLRITAPVDGIVAQRSVQLGQQVGPGTPLMAVVPLKAVWIDANFRETQLAKLRIGQPVTVHSDAYGSNVAFHGKVIGLSAGSGSAFALLPPQNASGNWIKIVQRLTVRVALDPKDLDAHPLRLGLSVAVDVDTSKHDGPPVTALPATGQSSVAPDTISPAITARIQQIIAANTGGAAR